MHAWRRWTAFSLLILVAAGLRLWLIDRIPPGFHLDESFEGLEAWRIYTDPSYRPVFLTGNFGVPPLNAYANALTFAVAEWVGGAAGPVAMRVTAALIGVLGVVAVFGLATEIRRFHPTLVSPAFPWLAAASLAVMRWHVHFSRMGIEPVMVPALWAAALWALLRAWRTGAWWAYVLCGGLLALGMYAYQAAWVIPWLAAATVLHLLWGERNAWRARWTGPAVIAVVALAGVAPLARFFLDHPDLLWMRPAQLAIVGETASPADDSIAAALWATAKMFGPWGAPGDPDPRRNLPGAPALNLWQALPFYLGLAWALWRATRPVYAAIVLGLVGLLAPGVISEFAPHFHRVLGASAPAALLCGLGLDMVARQRLWRPAAGPALVAVLVASAAVASSVDYFDRWAAQPDLYHAFDVGLWEGGQWVAALPPDERVYTSPRGAEHATLAFAWRTRAQTPVQFDGRYLFPLAAQPNPSAEHYFVVEYEDFRTRLLLPEVLPGAVVSREFLDANGNLYARVYTRPAGSPAARPPHHPFPATLGDGIALAGYDVLPESLETGASLYLQLHWLVDAPPAYGWTVFTHVVDAGGTRVAGFDSPPGRGSLPTTQWQAGWRVLDEYEIPLPPELAPGRYGVRVGLYRTDGAVLPATGAGIDLGEVELRAPATR